MTEIALIGNPNSGKTSLFNLLTGTSQRVGNWPGVTVERKSGTVKKHSDWKVQDLPGIYSMSPYTPEEKVARDYLLSNHADSILNVVDSTNLERNLYLTTQLIETGIPVTVALNMSDALKGQGKTINIDKLSYQLGVPVVSTSAIKNTGVDKVIKKAAYTTKETVDTIQYPTYSDKFEAALKQIIDILGDIVPECSARFYAIKFFERDALVQNEVELSEFQKGEINEVIKITEDIFTEDSESIVVNERYEFIERVAKMAQNQDSNFKMTISDKIDRVVTNRILALPIFAAVMFLVYYVSVTTVGTWATDWANDGVFGDGWSFFGISVPGVPVLVESALNAIGCADWLQALILDGIVAGVGAVLGFVPQMLVLFIFLAFLEACGYMARVAFIMDRIFRKFGLSGKSFIPMLIGSGCGVPGIMASRTIENDRDRKMTIMTTTFIPCGAKLPIIALIAGALFDGAWWVAPSAYFVGIAAIICSGIILKKTKMFAGDPAPFVMELPAYHMPTVGNVLRSMWERGFSFIKKAGTIILLSTIVLWFLMNFGWSDGSFGMLEAEQLDSSILAKIGSVIAPVFAPLGWGDWKMAVAAVTGLIAKENVVGTFGILFGFAEVAEDGAEIWGALAGSMTAVAAYSFLVFNLLCAPCFAAMGAIKREMNNAKWFWFAVGYQTLLAYVVSLCVYQIGTWITTGTFGIATAVACLLVIGFMYLLVRPYKESKTLHVNMKAMAGAK